MYLDTAYLAKLYILETDSAAVRDLVSDVEWIVSCGHARLELAFMLHRKMREGALRPAEFKLLFDQIESDISSGLIRMFPVSEALLATAFASAKSLSQKIFLRASDALHLVCAKEHGFREIYSNDKHLLAAAKHFGLKPRNIINPT
jgi:predicted nucleic acid-binding protein